MKKRVRKKWLKQHNLYVNPRDTWDMQITIAEFILPRLKLFKKVTNGYPGRDEMDTPEKWDDAIDKMIIAFEIIAEDNLPDTSNPNWIKECEEINNKVDEGLMLFAKWFRDLWW